MIDIAGGLLIAIVVIIVVPTIFSIVFRGWGQWRCVFLGHRWIIPEDDGWYGKTYRTTGSFSWHAGSHCQRCDRYWPMKPTEAMHRCFAQKTYQGARPR